MHKIMEHFIDRACRELEELDQKGGRLFKADWDFADKLGHFVKSAKTIIAMDEGYSQDNGMSGYGMSNRSYNMGGSYDNGMNGSYDNGYSSRRGRSETTGRYVSRDDGKQAFIDGLGDYMEKAPNDAVREIVRDAMNRAQRELM